MASFVGRYGSYEEDYSSYAHGQRSSRVASFEMQSSPDRMQAAGLREQQQNLTPSSNREFAFRDHWYLDSDDEAEMRGGRCQQLTKGAAGDVKALLLMLGLGVLLFFGLQELGHITNATRRMARGTGHADASWRDAVLGQRGRSRSVAAADSVMGADAGDGEASGSEFGTISEHPVRAGFCSTSAAFTGYYRNANRTRHLFYWYVESEGDPRRDPVVLMLVGGPGCAASTSLLTEGGPCHVDGAMRTVRNKHAWTKHASVIWIDQPAGVWFAAHETRRFNPLLLFGEAHYSPAVAAEILRGNAAQRTARASGMRLNLKGVAVGAGLVNPAVQFASLAPFLRDSAPASLVASVDLAGMAASTPLCTRRIRECERQSASGSSGASGNSSSGSSSGGSSSSAVAACVSARGYCLEKLVRPYMKSGRSIFDLRAACDHPPLCYDFSRVERFLQLPATLDALNVRHSSARWRICNYDVLKRYDADWLKTYEGDVARLLRVGVPVLVFAGQFDFICNWLGSRQWTQRLKWAGRAAFQHARERVWRADNGTALGTVAAVRRTLAFVRVNGAGHMISNDRPDSGEQLFRDFLSGSIFK
eukprot:g1968.t1